jgi:hypothetical protein
MITVTCLTSNNWRLKPLERGNGLPSGSLKHKAIASAASGDGMPRFIQNRSPTSVAALKSDAAAEKSKDQLSRDF